MTKLNERVEKVLDGEDFELCASVYIAEIDDYATANYTIQVVDPEELADDLGLTDELNQLANEYTDDTDLSDSVWDTVSDHLNSHSYDESLSGVVSGE
ncbi:hypothetical protein HWC09_gp030 [Lactobacillus phage 3-521]|uniref:Uncharacterized protein n=1 Tax=Lactobacillus phage 3-521 TaxID=2510943 RepID=A0A4Y5FF03_9CAUD|nr:hypothetical protein HWC09_gp030 [Lactobacillus phage 3-521]QBJ03689.1 hypothetical protein UCC3521_0151 [Lactobacillus phage 3-521]